MYNIIIDNNNNINNNIIIIVVNSNNKSLRNNNNTIHLLYRYWFYHLQIVNGINIFSVKQMGER